jgi:hypothetical protein
MLDAALLHIFARAGHTEIIWHTEIIYAALECTPRARVSITSNITIAPDYCNENSNGTILAYLENYPDAGW